MLPERTFAPSMAEVSLALTNGQTHQGHLGRFAPTQADITLALTRESKEKARFAAEQIAFVGSHRAAGEPPPRPNARKATIKVHVSGGKTFLVDPSEPEIPGGVGFYARPADAQSPYRELFFYNHGVNLRELNEPIGSLLVQDGRLGAKALETGLSAQQREQRTPIGQILVEAARVDASAMEQAASLQQRKGTRIGEVLIRRERFAPGDPFKRNGE